VIRIILLGRTGNNLFQYALGRVLAEKHGVPLVLDASWFNSKGWSEVSHFLRMPLQANVVRRFSLGTRALRNLTGKHYWEYSRCPVLRETKGDQSFDPRFLEAPKDCLLFGYFQSPLYFQSVARPLRDDLNGAFCSSVKLQHDLRQMLSSPDSVAVHVRRGDYLVISDFQVCGSKYHWNAIRRMRDENPSARFFIFSDDPDWCRNEFKDRDMTVMDANPNPTHDLHLMSLAAHHIIANSSYSWWAAWLGEKPGQRVLMPDRWYARDIIAPIHEKQMPHWQTIPTSED
jgi:Glycosyl transferase family 11